MMTNLFSTFDPSTSINTSLNWMSSLISMLLLPSMLWLIPSRTNFLFIKINSLMHKEFKILMKNNMKGSTLLFISLLLMIAFNNFMGLFPYIFTSSSHMSMTLTMALPLWMSFMLFGWMNNFNHMMTHLVPLGTPTVLMPFMVCIETISNLIRPGTLAIRLSANMIAGHLLMTLLGNSGSSISLMLINILLITQIMLMVLELAVSIIQSYVFSILSTLYSSEVS